MGPRFLEGGTITLRQFYYCFIQGWNASRMWNIAIWQSVAVREHKNSRRLPHNTLPYDCKVCVVAFLQNYAEENAILLQGISETTYMQLLPSNNQEGLYSSQNLLCNVIYHSNPQGVWMQYKISCEAAGLQAAAYPTLTSLWRQLTPQIRIRKPMSDLCWVCQKNSTAIMRAANKPESAKSDVSIYSLGR